MAKTRAYSMLLLAFERSEPILPVGLQMISAATPDFQAKPRPVMQELRNAGKTKGILIFLIIFVLLIPITVAISINLLSIVKSEVSI